MLQEYGFELNDTNIIYIENVSYSDNKSIAYDATRISAENIDYKNLPEKEKKKYYISPMAHDMDTIYLPTGPYILLSCIGFGDGLVNGNRIPTNIIKNNGKDAYYLHCVVLRVEGPHYCLIHYEWSSQKNIKYIYYNDSVVCEITEQNVLELLKKRAHDVIYFRADLLGRTTYYGDVKRSGHDIVLPPAHVT